MAAGFVTVWRLAHGDIAGGRLGPDAAAQYQLVGCVRDRVGGPILATGIDPPAIQALSSSFDKEGV